MPGIFGVVSKNKEFDDNAINSMLNECQHEEFYNTAIYKDKEKNIHLGGITIHNSFSDCLPIYNSEKKIIMFFDGEIYLDDKTISSIACKNKTINASILMEMYEDNPDSFYEKLNGWYCGAILDLKRNQFILFNDDYAIKRLYYTETEEGLYFASEAKALLRVLPQTREIDNKGLGEYFTYDCVLENRTLFKNINLLPPHSKWTYHIGDHWTHQETLNVKRYEGMEPLDEEEFLDVICQKYEELLPKYFRGDKIGFSLTGGLDTRTQLSIIAKDFDYGKLPCYTFTSAYNTSLDAKIAKQISTLIRQPFTPITLKKLFLEDFKNNAEKAIFITDGVTDVSRADEIYLNKEARKFSDIRITGKFGSQVMRSLSVLKDRSIDSDLINNEFYRYIEEGKQTFEKHLGLKENVNPLTFMLFKEIPWYWAGFTVAEMSQLTVRSPYLDKELVELLYRTPEKLSGILDISMQAMLIKKHSETLSNLMTDKGLQLNERNVLTVLKKFYYMIQNYSDKIYNSEKLPMDLHHVFHKIEHMLSFFNITKLLAGRNTFRHYRHWYKNELADYVKDVMLDSKTLARPYLNQAVVEKACNEHIQGKKNNTSIIKKVMTLELINKVLIDHYKNIGNS